MKQHKSDEVYEPLRLLLLETRWWAWGMLVAGLVGFLCSIAWWHQGTTGIMLFFLSTILLGAGIGRLSDVGNLKLMLRNIELLRGKR